MPPVSMAGPMSTITSAANANAYSVAQQLVTTAWGILFAIVMLIRAFGWSDGRTLVAQSYGQAKEKSAEQSAARKVKRQAKKETRHHAAASADQGDEADLGVDIQGSAADADGMMVSLIQSVSSAFGSGIFLQGNQSITFTASASETTSVSDVITDQRR